MIDKIKNSLILFAAVCLAVMGARRYGEALGRKAERGRMTAVILKQVEEARDADLEAAAIADDDVARRLRDRWTR